MSKTYKIVAPEFFDRKVTVEDYYADALTDAIVNETDVFCFFEGDRHAYLSVADLMDKDLSTFTISDEELSCIEITDETVFE